MRLFIFSIIMFNASCSSLNIKPNISGRKVASSTLEKVPFNFDLIEKTLIKFQNLNRLPHFQNRSMEVDEEFANCSVKIKKNYALNKLFDSLKVNFSKFLADTIELYECDGKNTSSAWLGPFSVFYENNFYFEIIDKFGVEEGNKLVLANLAHELGHLIHEYSTLQENSGIDGLSVSGLLSKHYKSLHPPFCKNEFISKGSYDTFGCKLENSVYAHYEVDAFGIALLFSIGFANPSEYSKKFLDYYLDRKLRNETDPNYIERKKNTLELRKQFIDHSTNELRKYF